MGEVLGALFAPDRAGPMVRVIVNDIRLPMALMVCLWHDDRRSFSARTGAHAGVFTASQVNCSAISRSSSPCPGSNRRR